jgi:hypothetical protein
VGKQKKLTPEVMDAIRVDREERGMTLTTIMERHGLSRGTAYKAIEHMDDSKVVRASPTRRVVPPFVRPPRPPLSKANLGETARQLLAARMMQAGLYVFQPLGEDTPVDLLVLRDDGVALKCQCKTMFVNASGAHVMPLCAVRKWGPNAKVVKHRYTRQEVDFFLGYAFEVDRAYVFPYEATSHVKTLLYTWILRQPMGRNDKPRFDPRPYENAFHLLESPVSSVEAVP